MRMVYQAHLWAHTLAWAKLQQNQGTIIECTHGVHVARLSLESTGDPFRNAGLLPSLGALSGKSIPHGKRIDRIDSLAYPHRDESLISGMESSPASGQICPKPSNQTDILNLMHP